MDETVSLTDAQRVALADLGIPEARAAAFLQERPVVVALRNGGQGGIAIIQKVGLRLRCGVVAINDPGRGIKTLAQFRGRCQLLATRFGLAELELFGAAVINPKLAGVLLRQGFERQTDAIPDELGGGQVEILTRVFPVPRGPES